MWSVDLHLIIMTINNIIFNNIMIFIIRIFLYSVCACGKWICTSQKCPQHSQLSHHHIRFWRHFADISWDIIHKIRFGLHESLLFWGAFHTLDMTVANFVLNIHFTFVAAPPKLLNQHKALITMRKKMMTVKRMTSTQRTIMMLQKMIQMWKISDGSKTSRSPFWDRIWKITKQQDYNRGGDFSKDNYDLPDVKDIRWF